MSSVYAFVLAYFGFLKSDCNIHIVDDICLQKLGYCFIYTKCMHQV